MEIRIPPLSESVSTATLMTWRKKEGEPVKRDEVLIEVETDKVVLEIPAPESGVLKRIVKADGASVVSNELIAELDTGAQPAARPAAGPRPNRSPPRHRPPSRPPR